MVGFTYRRVPAVTLMRDLIAQGRIGRVQQVRASYRQDWLVDPEMPLGWRLQKEHAGSGALGDIGAHAIDLAQFVTGQDLTAVSGVLETIVTERPVQGSGSGLSGAGSLTTPQDTRAAFMGYNYVIDGRELKPPYVATGFVTLRSVIAKRPKVVSSFMHAMAESLKIMMRDREPAYRLMAKKIG